MNEVTTAQMKELERLADAAGLPYLRMMENAGTAAARELMARVPGLKAAAVFCGRGNNGGDGLVAARRLQDAGVEVIAVLAEGEPATPDAAANREAAQDRGVHIQTLDGLTLRDEVFIARADALVDAVYGTGFHGALRPAGQRAAAMLNSGRFVLALDVPSGVCADTGRNSRRRGARACHRCFPRAQALPPAGSGAMRHGRHRGYRHWCSVGRGIGLRHSCKTCAALIDFPAPLCYNRLVLKKKECISAWASKGSAEGWP